MLTQQWHNAHPISKSNRDGGKLTRRTNKGDPSIPDRGLDPGDGVHASDQPCIGLSHRRVKHRLTARIVHESRPVQEMGHRACGQWGGRARWRDEAARRHQGPLGDASLAICFEIFV